MANNDGYLKLWVNGTLSETIANVDNDTHSIDTATVGARAIEVGTTGTHGTDNQRWTMTYDGDGRRVQEDHYDGTTTVTTLYFAGGMYEVTDPSGANTITRYYGIAGQRVAKHDGTNLQYMLTDAQGSTVVTLNSTGTLLSQQRYMPFGDVRTDIDTVGETDFGYTGQREIEGSELMDYRYRFLSNKPALPSNSARELVPPTLFEKRRTQVGSGTLPIGGKVIFRLGLHCT